MNRIYDVDKSLRFIEKKISQGYIKIMNINRGTKDIYINEGKYELSNNLEDEYKGVFIYEENENYIYNFKTQIENAKEYLGSNSFIILRYVHPYDDLLEVEKLEEEFIKTLKLKKFIDIESYVILPKENDEKYKLLIMARWHIDLLADKKEYEDYTKNFEEKKSSCRGEKGSGCSSQNCSGCNSKKGCCKKIKFN